MLTALRFALALALICSFGCSKDPRTKSIFLGGDIRIESWVYRDFLGFYRKQLKLVCQKAGSYDIEIRAHYNPGVEPNYRGEIPEDNLKTESNSQTIEFSQLDVGKDFFLGVPTGTKRVDIRITRSKSVENHLVIFIAHQFDDTFWSW